MKKTTLFLATLLMACGAAANAANTDDMWEITTAMQMDGMSMPATTQKSCIAKNQPYKPEQQDKNCTMYDVKVMGNKTSWKMKCTGANAMEGTGVMTKTATRLDGVITTKSQGEQMTMKMSGRVVGKCDMAEEQKKTEATIANAKAYQTKALEHERESKRMALEAERRSCEQTRKDSVANFSSYESLKQRAENDSYMKSRLANCKINLDASRKQLCGKATVDDWQSAKKYCPDEYKAMKIQHCTGRSNSYRDMCDTPLARGIDAAGGHTGTSRPVLDGAKGLINILGF